MRALLETRDLSIATPAGRTLVAGLTMHLPAERVALVGRNGIGKSTLLAALAAGDDPRIVVRGRAHCVPQIIPADGMSHGEARREALERALSSEASILLLDEPTEDLDENGVDWLRSTLRRWTGCALIATHDRRLLADFRHFFIVSEAGCEYVQGSLGDLEHRLEDQQATEQRAYAARLQRLVAAEEHAVHVGRRKARKKQYGRSSEIDRATPRIRLNAKRGQAQVSHGRISQVRAERLAELRDRTRVARRALRVELTPSLSVSVPRLGPASTVIDLRGVGHLDGPLAGDRIGIVGPNGAGKTTLLQIVLGERSPRTGVVWRDLSKIGAIHQGAANWMLEQSLIESLGHLADLAEVLARHRFPLALADRPLRTLSPGERARAALLCLLANAPPIEMLLLDEPTFSLDLVGQRAITDALRAWTGGLIVASHDRTFLTAIGIDRFVELAR